MARPNPDKMSFLEHLDELRSRLVHGVAALAVGFAACWGFREPIFHFLTGPMRQVAPDIKFYFMGPSGGLLIYMKMVFFVGIFVAAPYILYQVWAFISPGLYPNERMWAIPFIVFGTLFFLGGAAFGHFFLFPITFRFLVGFGGTDMQYLPRTEDYFTFYSWFLLGLGAVFQVPVITFVLARIGLVTPAFLIRQWKWVVLLSFVISAVITPTPDVVTQTLLAVPMVGLYLLGVSVAWLFGRARRKPASVSVEARS